MDNNENFDQYSLEELRQMLKNLDRQRFADDVLSIEREIAKRTGEPMPEPIWAGDRDQRSKEQQTKNKLSQLKPRFTRGREQGEQGWMRGASFHSLDSFR